MTATEAKAKFLGLLDDVDGGDTVEGTNHGRTVARLVPARAGGRLRGPHLAGVEQGLRVVTKNREMRRHGHPTPITVW